VASPTQALQPVTWLRLIEGGGSMTNVYKAQRADRADEN
jgi:hypothetical protein